MKSIRKIISEKPYIAWVLFGFTLIIVFLLGLLAASIIERRTEAVFAYKPRVDYPDWEPRNAVWGKNFPREFQSFLKTADTTFKSKYNGSASIDMLAEYPELIILWAGYPFSLDYMQARGHYYAITDIRNTLRTGAPVAGKTSPMPNTCWTCKSADVPRLMKVTGVAEFYKGTWETKGHEMHNPIGCVDCHDAQTMNLHISRPALIEAFQRTGKDINKVTHQDMRSLVCAQCHVEYYFNKEKIKDVSYLTFPWDKGITADSIEKYYDQIKFTDWIHGLSKAPMLKAQHPDYELFLTGVHAKRGIACADCHMPYVSEGGQKFTNHHIQSPLNNITSSCQVCHHEETEQLINDVYERQDKIAENRRKLEELLVRAHMEAKTAWDKGATNEQMKDILMLIRQAQWRWDFVAAGHGNAVHSPVESSRLIASGINKAQEARLKLTRLLATLGYTTEVPYPDILTKIKAQEFIGLDMKKINQDKEEFQKTIIPGWLNEAFKREKAWNEHPANTQ
jgi:nitrite reductase (cytochrome c-552)